MPASTDLYIDANVLLRFLRNDHPQMSPRAAKFIDDANHGSFTLHVSAVTVAEIFYTLKASYKVQKRLAARTLTGLLNSPAFHLDEPHRILDALARVDAANVDFG